MQPLRMLKIKEKTIELKGHLPNGVALSHFKDSFGKHTIYLEPIDSSIEKQIDISAKKYGSVQYWKNDKCIATAKQIFCYGEIDLDKEEDWDLIGRFNIYPPDGGWMYSNVDFETGIVVSVDRKFKQFQTWDCFKWFEYNYMLIGCPKRIIIYRKDYGRIKCKN